MISRLDDTHDPAARSWEESANDPASDFPIQNLPLGAFRDAEGGPGRIGIAIGDRILDLPRLMETGLLAALDQRLRVALGHATLNGLMAMGRRSAQELRLALFELLRAGAPHERAVSGCLLEAREVELLLPASVGDYSDFYASIHHATNVGRLFRPDQPLLPNYKWVPIGYHGRASSVIASGTRLRRPVGQVMEDGAPAPVVLPSRALDYECELAGWIGEENPLGTPVPLAAAEDRLFGLGLLNDWSARDIQRWEYQPLGPFLSKSFGTTVSPWVVTLDALEPFRTPISPRPEGDPEPLPYLDSEEHRQRGGFSVDLEVRLVTRRMRESQQEPVRLSRCSATNLYWSMFQLLAHHASNGCNLRPGDLLGSGTISGPTKDSLGCLLELTSRGKEPLALPSGETRRFLEDGDEVILRARCEREGYVGLGFGECRGRVES